MGDKGTIMLPEGASTLSPEVDALYYFVYWISLFMFIGVIGAMVYFMFKYRRRDNSVPPLHHENKMLEAVWIVVPTILVLVVFTWGFKVFLKLETSPPGAYQITVRGQKWAWMFEYPNGSTSTNEIRVPVGRPVKLNMSSADVLHSFFVPAFRVKQDVLPNRYTSLWFEATKQDTFQVFCTEYCGTSHSGMLAKLIVLSEEDFNTWLQESQIDPNASPAERGAKLYTDKACVGCHNLNEVPAVGPSFQGLFGKERPLADGSTVTADENYLRESILQPGAKVVQGFPPAMPNAYGNLSAEELDALIAFIKEQQ